MEQEIERYQPLYKIEVNLKNPREKEYIRTPYCLNKTHNLYLNSKDDSRKTSINYLIGNANFYNEDIIDLDVFCEIMSMDTEICKYILMLQDKNSIPYKEALLHGDLVGPLHIGNCSAQSLAMLILRQLYNYYINKKLSEILDG